MLVHNTSWIWTQRRRNCEFWYIVGHQDYLDEDDYLGIFDGTKVDDDGGEEEDEDGEGEGDHPPAAVADCATAVQKQPTFVPEKFISETHLNTILSS